MSNGYWWSLSIVMFRSPGMILDAGAPPMGARGLCITDVSHKSFSISLLLTDGVFLLINPGMDIIIMNDLTLSQFEHNNLMWLYKR